jgi:hypothetical protein
MSSYGASFSVTSPISDTVPAVQPKEKPITVEDIDLSVSESQSFTMTVQAAYKSHPPSFIVSIIILIFGAINFISFIQGLEYLLHPIIAIGLLLLGLGMLLTMLVANKNQ